MGRRPSWGWLFGPSPLLWYARRAAIEAGRNVLLVTDAFDRESDDPARSVDERCEATLGHVRAQDAHPLLIAKSLSSLAAPFAATARLAAVWLAPLIRTEGSSTAAEVVSGLRALAPSRSSLSEALMTPAGTAA